EVLGGISLYTVDSRAAGRIRLKEPVVASHGDRFILRSVSPSVTLGGGVVLNPHPARRFSEEVIRDLMHDDPAMRIVGLAKDAGLHGISRRRIDAVFADAGQKTEKLIAGLLSSGELVRFDAANDLMVHGSYLERLKAVLLSGVRQYHEKNPSSPGISREHLRSSVQGGVDPKLFHRVLQDLIRKGDLSESGPIITAKGFSASMASDHTDALEAIAKAVEAAAFAPPRVVELAEQLRLPQRKVLEILAFLCREGRLVRINDELYLSGAHEQALRERVREFIEQNQALAPADMKTIVGATRKFAIPFLEYLDRIHFTIRVGDARKLAAARGSS
ncbi:MAG: SelB C-terminal domain-containing protein, partial [Methanomassiliicoccales archaeon]|nr:SelB C-terminal domain-containing protein [Methanomassiliicoccales archaeon]